MSAESLVVVRRLYDGFLSDTTSDAYRRGEIPQDQLSLLDPEIDFDQSDSGLPDVGDGRYQGIEGVREFWQHFLEAWQTVHFEYELIDAGEQVVGLIDQRLLGRATGIEFPVQYAQVITVREGRIIRFKTYAQRDDALRAAGLSE